MACAIPLRPSVYTGPVQSPLGPQCKHIPELEPGVTQASGMCNLIPSLGGQIPHPKVGS